MIERLRVFLVEDKYDGCHARVRSSKADRPNCDRVHTGAQP
jgi:hypothetical protein